ncbi:MAG: hypothetical protein RR408_00400 [Carnobacterium sp.]|uniref:immunoglobulin-like domain-containing protein n=2 Tax=Carnobacterium sp. TaxID=48221 RepID=UPI002FCAFCE2
MSHGPKRIKIGMSLLFLALFLMSCSKPLEKTPLDDKQINQLAGVSMSAEQEAYPVGTDQITVLLKNKSVEDYYYGKAFSLEKEVDDQWFVVPFEEDIAFIEIAILLGSGEETTESIDLSLFKGKLAAGKYRVLKEVAGETLTAEFLIEDN